MPPSIHPVHLITVLRQKSLTTAIVCFTSRRACDEALQAFEHTVEVVPRNRQEEISRVLDELIGTYASIKDHPLREMVTTYGVAAHHAGHLPSWKIAIEELMRRGGVGARMAAAAPPAPGPVPLPAVGAPPNRGAGEAEPRHPTNPRG